MIKIWMIVVFCLWPILIVRQRLGFWKFKRDAVPVTVRTSLKDIPSKFISDLRRVELEIVDEAYQGVTAFNEFENLHQKYDPHNRELKGFYNQNSGRIETEDGVKAETFQFRLNVIGISVVIIAFLYWQFVR